MKVACTVLGGESGSNPAALLRNFISQKRHNPETGEVEKYYRLKESYRDAMGRPCSQTLLNVGFIHGLKPDISGISAGYLRDKRRLSPG